MENIDEMALDELYYIVLLCNKYGEKETPYDMDMVWNNISKYYYLENNVNIDDKTILYEWLKNRARYPLLDSLVLEVLNKFINEENEINKVDSFFISNILEMRKIIIDYGKKISDNSSNDIKLSKMDRNEVIGIVSDIFSEIDPTFEWLEIYKKVANEHIIYMDSLNYQQRMILEKLLGIDLSMGDNNLGVFLNDKKCGYVLLTYTGTISDVATTVHEITHYISRYKNDWREEEPILREFSAIFFELYALNYLKRMGYDEKELKMINQDRFSNMTRLLDDALIIIDYLIMLIEHGEIKEEYDLVLDKYTRADECINDLVFNPYLLNDYYPYLIGNYLAMHGIEKTKDDKYLLSMIKYVTDNISKMEVEDIFDIVGCGNPNFIKYDTNLFKEEPKKRKRIK